jgi:ABC-type bacteriocin/lantibiotic exporter with double-glycine peptidase domain
VQDSGVGSAYNDIKACKTALFICIGLAFVYATLYIYIMSIFPTQLAWLSVILVELIFAGGAGLCFYARNQSNDAGQ